MALVRSLIADDRERGVSFNTRYSRLVLSTISRVTARFSAVVSQEDMREIYATFCVQLLATIRSSCAASTGTRQQAEHVVGLLASHTAYDFLRGARRNLAVQR